MIYNNFIYYNQNNKDLFKRFYSYTIFDEKDFMSNLVSENYLTYLDFDRVIRVPDSVDDKDVKAWTVENWKVGSPGFHNVFEEDGIFFKTEDAPAKYLVKKISEIIKQKIKLFYFSLQEELSGEYMAYPDKDGVDIVYKPINSCPAPVLEELKNKMEIVSRNELNSQKDS
jgi:hypothetical protein